MPSAPTPGSARWPGCRHRPHDHPELRGATRGERLLLAHLAYSAAAAGVDAGIVRSLARRALGDDLLLRETGVETSLGYAAACSLWLIDDYPAALAHLDTALELARRRGSAVAYGIARAGRAAALMRMGSLADAEADALDALALATEHELGLIVPLALYPLVWLRVDRGDLDAAEAALSAYGFAEAIPRAAVFSLLFYTRGRIRLARGQSDDAAEDLLAAGGIATEAEATSPSLFAWRSDAAFALAASGRHERVASLVAEELGLARRAGTPRAIGLALRADALLGPAEHRAGRLHEAVDLLRRAGCRVELAARSPISASPCGGTGIGRTRAPRCAKHSTSRTARVPTASPCAPTPSSPSPARGRGGDGSRGSKH